MTFQSQGKIYEVAVLGVRELAPGTSAVRFERPFNFVPGQFVKIGLPGFGLLREYSIYSASQDSGLEVLVRAVDGGTLSPRLCRIRPGDVLLTEGPFGHFVISKEAAGSRKFVFVAGGTGIAPFHSMVRSRPDLNYRLLHGVSYVRELYDRDHFDRMRHTACVTREPGGDFQGRVTALLETMPISPDEQFYFCGGNTMIMDGFRILAARGVERNRLFAEIYF